MNWAPALAVLYHPYACSPSTSHLPPEWYWKVLLRHWVYRVCAVILFLFSLIIVWSEATFGIPNVRLSIIANIIYLGHNNTNYIVIEVGVCTIPSSHAPPPPPPPPNPSAHAPPPHPTPPTQRALTCLIYKGSSLFSYVVL